MEVHDRPAQTSSKNTGLSFESHMLSSSVLNSSEQEIGDVLHKLEIAKKSSGNPHRPWQNLGDGRCVKYDSGNYQAKLLEARMMDFVRLRTSIPVPQIYLLFMQDDVVYIVMEFIKGDALVDSYRATSSEDLQDIATQLKDYIQQLRNLSITPSMFPAACDGLLFDNVYFRPLPWDHNSNEAVPLPSFDSVDAFNAYWIKRAKLGVSLEGISNSAIALTHGDLVGRNILIDNGKVVSILDWETVGWYPAFWETMILWRDSRWSKKWRAALNTVCGPRTTLDDAYIQLLDSAFKEPQGY